MTTATFTTTAAFTRTHARYIGSKVAADLRRMRAFYGKPSTQKIDDYYKEFTELLAAGFLGSVEYGFKRNGQRIVSLKWDIQIGSSYNDDRSGRVPGGADIAGAEWFSFLFYSDSWTKLNLAQREAFKSKLPIKRTEGSAPVDGAGYWEHTKTYSSNGVGALRRQFRPY